MRQNQGVLFVLPAIIVMLVVTAFPMLRAFGFPVVFDVTHSLQLPGAGDGVTAGLAAAWQAAGRSDQAIPLLEETVRLLKSKQGGSE